jgi:hypothetical protein
VARIVTDEDLEQMAKNAIRTVISHIRELCEQDSYGVQDGTNAWGDPQYTVMINKDEMLEDLDKLEKELT